MTTILPHDPLSGPVSVQTEAPMRRLIADFFDSKLAVAGLIVFAAIVLIAIVGTAGLHPALAAIRAGKDIAVASKEISLLGSPSKFPLLMP